MKTGTNYLSAALVAGIIAFAPLAHGQAPLITSFGKNGVLTANGLEPGSLAAVEWAPSIEGEWITLHDIIVEQDGSIETSVPRFFRVRGIPSNPDSDRLAWIPPGTFTMGSPVTEPERNALVPETGLGDERQHEVTITTGFWMGKYEVTQEEYSDVRGVNPSTFKGPDLPVQDVSWLDATAFCNTLTEREIEAGRVPDGHVYRLPTEAEWEYACRAGTTTVFHYGNDLRSGMASFRGTMEYSLSEGGVVSNPLGITLESPTVVGSFEPNAWGIYDMHGSMWEWCYDWIDNYAFGAVADPVITVNRFQVGARVARSGSWRAQVGARSARSAHRNFWVPGFTNSGRGNVGFRIVLARPIE